MWESTSFLPIGGILLLESSRAYVEMYLIGRKQNEIAWGLYSHSIVERSWNCDFGVEIYSTAFILENE
jgi:hypothetical protein